MGATEGGPHAKKG